MVAVSVERVLINWAKNTTSIFNLCGGRIYNLLPAKATMPALTIRRVGGGFDDGEAPLDIALVQFDAYSYKAMRNDPAKRVTPDYAGAENLLIACMDEMHTAAQLLSQNGWIYGFEIAGIRHVVEEDTQWARYAADVFATVRKIA